MAAPFEFSPTFIDDHTEKVGIDIRPVIEYKLDRHKLFEFGNRLVDKYPNLFESLVQYPSEFLIRKKFIFPGKGEIDLPTMAISQRGPVFIFPRKIVAFEEETDLGQLDVIVVDCLKIFKQTFPGKKVLRVGQVNEYIFNTSQLDSTKLISERFTRFNVPSNGEIRLRINCPSDDHNRVIELEAVRKIETIPEIPDRSQTKGYGVKVTVDFNNREMSKDLDMDDIRTILHHANEYNQNNLYQFLKCSSEGE
ncbi:MAG: hypothetical protein KAJ46_00935 [Sedimentisphaerales bacterium]|nr:hypothetical protein [Sedimentisphaerales bacterium]